MQLHKKLVSVLQLGCNYSDRDKIVLHHTLQVRLQRDLLAAGFHYYGWVA
ncbi:hypothetical protein [Tychonema bourrellyi]|nr:hypothetical protein [Tychonema bourrellyi]